MKNLHLLFVFIPLFVFGQNSHFGVYVPMDIPIQHMMPKAGVAGGLGINFFMQPVSRIPMALELRGNLGNYSNKTLEQTYLFDDGSQTVTDVTYSSNFHKILFGVRFSTEHDLSAFRVYATPQIGIGIMSSKIRIADPEDEDDCKPLEIRITQRFSGVVYGGELGVDIELGRLFSSKTINNNHRLNIGINYLGSFKDFQYVNIKHMENKTHGVAHENPEEDRDVTTQFINVSSNNLHEHKIAELYKTRLSFIGIHIGYVYRF